MQCSAAVRSPSCIVEAAESAKGLELQPQQNDPSEGKRARGRTNDRGIGRQTVGRSSKSVIVEAEQGLRAPGLASKL